MKPAPVSPSSTSLTSSSPARVVVASRACRNQDAEGMPASGFSLAHWAVSWSTLWSMNASCGRQARRNAWASFSESSLCRSRILLRPADISGLAFSQPPAHLNTSRMASLASLASCATADAASPTDSIAMSNEEAPRAPTAFPWDSVMRQARKASCAFKKFLQCACSRCVLTAVSSSSSLPVNLRSSRIAAAMPSAETADVSPGSCASEA
eukprot:scaffold1175_cov248-Pinguiococcus_pyrenoidosus.AAC.4